MAKRETNTQEQTLSRGEYVEKLLKLIRGGKTLTEAAKELGLSRQAATYKIKAEGRWDEYKRLIGSRKSSKTLEGVSEDEPGDGRGATEATQPQSKDRTESGTDKLTNSDSGHARSLSQTEAIERIAKKEEPPKEKPKEKPTKEERAKRKSWDTWLWVAVGIGGGFLVWFLWTRWKLWRQSRKKEETSQPQAIMTPEMLRRARLEELKRRYQWKQ